MIQTFTFQPAGADGCYVEAYLHSEWQSAEIMRHSLPAVVICPGGGYEYTSDREGEPVAMEYYHAGYHAFVVHYAVKEHAGNFQPLCQLAAVIAHIRKQAEEWNVQENKIAVCGFSAGGHLAGSLGTLANTKSFQKVWGRNDPIRPDAMILCYPVILADEFAHEGSIMHVSESQPGTDTYCWFGLDRHVTGATPPTFLWHTAADSVVPVENSLSFAGALSREKVPFEMHIFPEGNHGMSVCSTAVNASNPYLGRWVAWSIAWLNKLFCYEK